MFSGNLWTQTEGGVWRTPPASLLRLFFRLHLLEPSGCCAAEEPSSATEAVFLHDGGQLSSSSSFLQRPAGPHLPPPSRLFKVISSFLFAPDCSGSHWWLQRRRHQTGEIKDSEASVELSGQWGQWGQWCRIWLTDSLVNQSGEKDQRATKQLK